MNKGRASVRALTSDFPGALLLKTLEAVPDLLLWQELDSRESVTLLSCFPDAPIAKTFRAYQISTVFAASGSTLFLHGAPTSSGASAGLHNGSATRKYKCLWTLLELLHRMRARTPGGRTLLGLFLEIAHSNRQQSRLIGEGSDRLASSRRATHSVPEGAIGIPLLFLCLYSNPAARHPHQ